MWWDHEKKKLKVLFEELRSIAMLDRLYTVRIDLTPDDPDVYALHEVRQSEIRAEIKQFTARKGHGTSSSNGQAIRSWQEISFEAAGEDDFSKLIALANELQHAWDEREGKIRTQESSSAA